MDLIQAPPFIQQDLLSQYMWYDHEEEEKKKKTEDNISDLES